MRPDQEKLSPSAFRLCDFYKGPQNPLSQQEGLDLGSVCTILDVPSSTACGQRIFGNLLVS